MTSGIDKRRSADCCIDQTRMVIISYWIGYSEDRGLRISRKEADKLWRAEQVAIKLKRPSIKLTRLSIYVSDDQLLQLHQRTKEKPNRKTNDLPQSVMSLRANTCRLLLNRANPPEIQQQSKADSKHRENYNSTLTREVS